MFLFCSPSVGRFTHVKRNRRPCRCEQESKRASEHTFLARDLNRCRQVDGVNKEQKRGLSGGGIRRSSRGAPSRQLRLPKKAALPFRARAPLFPAPPPPKPAGSRASDPELARSAVASLIRERDRWAGLRLAHASRHRRRLFRGSAPAGFTVTDGKRAPFFPAPPPINTPPSLLTHHSQQQQQQEQHNPPPSLINNGAAIDAP